MKLRALKEQINFGRKKTTRNKTKWLFDNFREKNKNFGSFSLQRTNCNCGKKMIQKNKLPKSRLTVSQRTNKT